MQGKKIMQARNRRPGLRVSGAACIFPREMLQYISYEKKKI